ncbi:hypothetical protein TNCV_2153331 [Trichonephila clavipes]|nr:hypothetical protein TNCV_2153331 [Trichonephila clavipes]
MNTDKTMVAKGFGGKNFPILNKGNQVARCEGEIGVPNRGPRAVKGCGPSPGILQRCKLLEIYASRFAGGSIMVVRGTTTEASLSIGAMIPCVAQSTTSREHCMKDINVSILTLSKFR